MNGEFILGVVIILFVAAAVIAAVRIYQRVREDTGYHRGRYYRFRQHMGGYFGNHQMNKLGVEDDGSRTETDEEMYYFSESDNSN